MGGSGERAGDVARRWPRRAAGIVVLVVCVISTVAAAVVGWRGHRVRRRAERAALERIDRAARDAARSIDATLRQLPDLARALADDFASGRVGEAEADRALRAAAADRPWVAGLSVRHRPGLAGSGARLVSRHLQRAPDGRLVPAVARDGTDPTKDEGYRLPMLVGETWLEPRHDAATGSFVVAYAVPFASGGAGGAAPPQGLVTLECSMAEVWEGVDATVLGQLGYHALWTEDGRFLVHPVPGLVTEDTTIFEVAWERDDAVLHSLAIDGIRGRRGRVEHVDPLSGRSSWLFIEPVAATGWTLAVVLARDELALEPTSERRRWISFIAALTVAAGTAVLFVVTWGFPGRERAPWLASGLVSGILALAMAASWVVAARHPEPSVNARERIIDRPTLERWIDRESAREATVGGGPRVFLPTGVFVKSVDLAGGYDVVVSGAVWQVKLHDPPVEPGFVFTEAVEASISEPEHVGEDYVRWDFTTTLRQDFSYTQFPFDRQEVWLRLRHTSHDDRVLLVPDLDSYPVTNPATMPGVERDLVLPGWRPMASYFNVRRHEYSGSPGAGARQALSGDHELQFNIEVRREFIGPLVSQVIPLFVAVAMVYAILFVASADGGRSQLLGFSALDSVLGCSALFFVMIFQHVSLREATPSPRIMYFEYFYFASYVALMLVSVNSLLFAARRPPRLIAANQSLLPKLLFWPLGLGALTLVTLRVCL